MYHINPAVIKSILASMSQKEFSIHMRFIRRQVPKCVPGSNRRQMFLNLYQWCVAKQQKEISDIQRRYYL
ncbi:hypothetical protein [Fluviicola taffensis]|uniref:Uncharacterized protein n=1 Tax=Fluviicola taffensis (strain DSM 16823 / NCIMB 13979 / RW262) TaxID=755732 RepID=F2IGG8_FLUTR|nr:hypothetical protein [Fluviicola taffensis]AEA42574.1 hypothetical protein Fluta_0569 [Fluviicola taffensis DSM 16823]